MSTELMFLSADAVLIGNPVVINSSHTRAGTTFWFTVAVALACLVLSRKWRAAEYVLYVAVFLGFVVILSTWLPGLAVGNSIRDGWESLYAGGGFGQFLAILLFLGILAALIGGFNNFIRQGSIGGLAVALVATLVFSTVPPVQELAVAYADNIVVRFMDLFW